jgi:hypothetical protein
VRRLSAAYAAAISSIDAANADDPTLLDVGGVSEPLALAHGRLASEWVAKLSPDASESVLLAARAHHLRRWAVPRQSYPEGRPGYLRWRRDQKARHATEVAGLLTAAGYADDVIERVQALIRREGLGSDPDTQLVEDAACLVFLKTQFAAFATTYDHAKVLDVVRKTAKKMSPAALALVPEVGLGPEQLSLIAEALA